MKKFQDLCKEKGLKCKEILLPGQPGACRICRWNSSTCLFFSCIFQSWGRRCSFFVHVRRRALGDTSSRNQGACFVTDDSCRRLNLFDQADIVVVGCRGMGNLKRALIGSVSTYAVHHCTAPVIVVRSNYIPSRLWQGEHAHSYSVMCHSSVICGLDTVDLLSPGLTPIGQPWLIAAICDNDSWSWLFTAISDAVCCCGANCLLFVMNWKFGPRSVECKSVGENLGFLAWKKYSC